MKTIITQKIDGYEIIVGFDKPVIDRVATDKKIEIDIKNEKEFILLDSIINKFNQITNRLNDLKLEHDKIINNFKIEYKRKNPAFNILKIDDNIIFDLLKPDKKNKLKQILYQVKLLYADRNKLLNKKNEASNNLSKKIKILKCNNPIYFQPRPGEICVEDEIADSLGKKIIDNPGCVVDIEGNIIINKVGVKYIKNGKIETVERIGIEPDGPLVEDISADEFEIMRLETMTDSEKENEMNGIIDRLACQAADMRSKLEIQGDNQALVKAQEWYKAEEQKVRDKYFPV